MTEAPLPEDLRELVEAIREDRLPDDRVAQMAARLGPLLAGGGGAAGRGSSSGLGGRLAAWTKVGAALAVVSALTIGALHHYATPAPPPTTVVDPGPSIAGDVVSTVASPRSSVAASSSLTGRDPEPPPSVAQKPWAGALAKAAPMTDATAEEEILGRARAALSANPGDALKLTALHAAKFPTGMLSQEREQLAIEALLLLGRRAEAIARARRFAVTWPRSPYVARLRVRGLLE